MADIPGDRSGHADHAVPSFGLSIALILGI
jgi:hypothetical protein